eukprot:gene52225-29569_t
MGDAVVALNVSGREFRVLRSTLMSLPGPLAVLAGGAFPTTADADDRPYVECDPDLFPYIINYLRRRRAFLPPDFSRWEELRVEFDFYSFELPPDAAELQQQQEAARQAL